MRPPISFGDALRAAHALAPQDDDARDAILAALGLTVSPAIKVAAPGLGVWKASSNAAIGRVANAPTVTVTAPDAAPAPVAPRAIEPGSSRTLATLDTTTSTSSSAPSWLSSAGAPLDEAPDVVPVLKSRSLFGTRTNRALLSTAVARLAAEGAPNVARILDTIAEGRPLRTLPRHVEPTLRLGADVLVDLGCGMDPFRQDVDVVLERFAGIVAADRLKVEYFTGTPLRGAGAAGADVTSRWTSTRQDAPVVVLTDFGIGAPLTTRDRATTGEWIEFAMTVRAAGRPLVAFVPYEARRWPPVLVRLVTMIHWSERTTAAAIRRAVREGARAWR